MRVFQATVGLPTMLVSLSTAQFSCKLQVQSSMYVIIYYQNHEAIRICAYKLCAALVCQHYSLLNRQIRLHARCPLDIPK